MFMEIDFGFVDHAENKMTDISYLKPADGKGEKRVDLLKCFN